MGVLPLDSRCLLSLVLCAAFLCVGPGLGHGAETDEAYQNARTALRNDQHKIALGGFRACLKQAEQGAERWRALLGVALSLYLLEKPAGALEYYRRFMAETRPHLDGLHDRWRVKRKATRQQVQKIDARLLTEQGMVSVLSKPIGVKVFVNQRRAGVHARAVTPFALYLTPGQHRVRVEHAGHLPLERTVVVAKGRRATELFNLKPVPMEPPEAPEPIGPGINTGAAAGDSGGTNRTLAWGLVAGGAAAVAGGVVFTAFALDTQDAQAGLDPALSSAEGNRRYDELDSRFHREQTISWVLYGVGGVSLAFGLKMLIFDGSGATKPKPTPTGKFSAFLTPAKDGLSARMRWAF